MADRYVKRPIVIEAMLFDGLNDEEALAFIGAPPHAGNAEDVEISRGYSAAGGVVIGTLEGDMLARPGDWIIRGVNGEFYPCKPDIFALTYEPAPVVELDKEHHA